MYKYDRELVITILDNILWALEQIEKRFRGIDTPDNFLDDDEGLTKLDGICLQLINIGEALKQVDKVTDKSLLSKYPQIEWKKVMGMRDIITHHYFDIDSETVFNVCDEHIPELKHTVITIKKDVLDH